MSIKSWNVSRVLMKAYDRREHKRCLTPCHLHSVLVRDYTIACQVKEIIIAAVYYSDPMNPKEVY